MLVKPTIFLEDVTQIDLDALAAQGIKGFLFDLDNTIMAPHAGAVEVRIETWLAKAKAQGFGCVILSNNKKLDYCQLAEKVLGIPVIAHAAKPRRASFRKALEMLNLTAKQVAMVGDRPLTDIWVGQRMGSMTILVDPLIKRHEKGHIRCLRAMERWFVKSH